MVLVLKCLVPKGYSGITLYPFIFLKEAHQKYDVVLLNHECIHLRQQLELLIVFFYLWYVIEFLLRLLFSGNWNKAYRNISFETEAYINESNLEYIKKRPSWAFLKYIF